jgi:hypothetical protein
MSRIIKAAILLLCVVLFAGCKDDTPPGGQRILCLEKTSLRLKSDATPFEVKGNISIVGRMEIDGKTYKNPTIVYYGHETDESSEIEKTGFRGDTVAIGWIEVRRTGKGMRLTPQPNTTGAERSLTIHFWNPSPSYYDCSLTVTQPSK